MITWDRCWHMGGSTRFCDMQVPIPLMRASDVERTPSAASQHLHHGGRKHNNFRIITLEQMDFFPLTGGIKRVNISFRVILFHILPELLFRSMHLSSFFVLEKDVIDYPDSSKIKKSHQKVFNNARYIILTIHCQIGCHVGSTC